MCGSFHLLERRRTLGRSELPGVGMTTFLHNDMASCRMERDNDTHFGIDLFRYEDGSLGSFGSRHSFLVFTARWK